MRHGEGMSEASEDDRWVIDSDYSGMWTVPLQVATVHSELVQDCL